jgi:hypothetical protein
VVTVFLALLLTADRDGKTDINLGGLMAATQLGSCTIKRSIAKLVKSGEITRQKHGSRITTTITNWSEYQMVSKVSQQQNPLVSKVSQYRDENDTNIGSKSIPIQYNKNNKKDKEDVADTHARTHEEFMADALNDLRVEQGCMAMRITPDEYRQLVTEVTNDWIFRNIPDNEWNFTHLLAQMRIKHNINTRNNGQQQTNDPITKLNQDTYKAMAALAAEMRNPVDAPF